MSESPTRARFTLIRLALALAIITYLDRVVISAAATAIRGDLGLSIEQMAWVFSAFTIAYAAFEIPSGWMGDVMGPRRVLTRIVLWWSAFTAATGFAWNFSSLVTARFLFGLGEAGAFPNTSRSFAKWLPRSERGAAHGVIFMGTRLGGAVAPPLVVMLMGVIGWRQTFMVFGLLGVVWCVFWWRWFLDEPAKHPSVNQAELALIERELDHDAHGRFRWSELLTPNLLLIYGMYFTMGYTLYFNLTWLPTYFQEVREFSREQSGWLSGAVLLTGGIATYFGGRLTDALVKSHGLKIGRSLGVVTLPDRRRAAHRRGVDTESDCGGRAAGRHARRGRPRRERLLVDLPRRRRSQRRRGHRRDEHVRQHRRRPESARGRLCGRLVGFVDDPLLCHRLCLRLRRCLHVLR